MNQVRYTNLTEAMYGLLGEAVEISGSSGLKYCVVGGWSPVLRNDPQNIHPGTHDVDLLFEDGVTEGALEGIVKTFISHGYHVSAKHGFQLIKVMLVGEESLAFNIDLLHPKMQQADTKREMFVDHLELAIQLDADPYERMRTMSIVLPNAGFLFDGFIVPERVHCNLPDGASKELEVPVIDEVGLLATKSSSCKGSKRGRDLFDIYMAITNPKDSAHMNRQLALLKTRHLAIYKGLGEIEIGLDAWSKNPDDIFLKKGIEFNKAAQEIRDFMYRCEIPIK